MEIPEIITEEMLEEKRASIKAINVELAEMTEQRKSMEYDLEQIELERVRLGEYKLLATKEANFIESLGEHQDKIIELDVKLSRIEPIKEIEMVR